MNARRAKQLTNFKSDLIFTFDALKADKSLALSRDNPSNDVVLITDAGIYHFSVLIFHCRHEKIARACLTK